MSVVKEGRRGPPAESPAAWAESAPDHPDAGVLGENHVAVVGGDIRILVAHQEADVREPTARRP
jgi:hypothetical protein